MRNDVNTMKDCKICRAALPDLLLNPAYAASHAEVTEHLKECTECRTELAELRATMDLMDVWTAPEPSLYFDSRMQARLREAVAAGPEGFWERMRSRLLFNTGRQFRPAMVGVLAFVLLAGGGGTMVDWTGHGGVHQAPVAASATLDDLKVLDNNAQAEQQMDQLLDDSSSSSDESATPPTS
jgi:predicted anti-sigma-YlaC factor YlaD